MPCNSGRKQGFEYRKGWRKDLNLIGDGSAASKHSLYSDGNASSEYDSSLLSLSPSRLVSTFHFHSAAAVCVFFFLVKLQFAFALCSCTRLVGFSIGLGRSYRPGQNFFFKYLKSLNKFFTKKKFK